MKIASSVVAVSNDYQHKSASARHVSMVSSAGSTSATSVELSSTSMQQQAVIEAGRNALQDSPGNIEGTPTESESDPIEAAYYDKSIYIMKMILERLSGTEIDLFDAHRFQQNIADVESQTTGQTPGQGPGQAGNPNDMMQIATYQYESQSNKLEFSGTIELENGKTTQFSFGLSFEQEYESVSLEMVKREELKDPLVISFTTKPVTLSDKRFEFDIDADQQKDSIAMLDSGNGFLALDRNGDNTINDGTELFGALSGNGFADLAQHDDNQDGFIDENDSIFKDLSVWIKNENEDKLVKLSDTGIGAIALENVDSPFTIRSQENQDENLGYIRKSGFYLDENGKAGLIQQLDFVV
jgi:hypothetical protein